MTRTEAGRRRGTPVGMEPLSPQRKWRAITIATIVLAPAFWSILAGLVAIADEGTAGPDPAGAIAFGLAVIPFSFIALAFLSEHPRAPGAVVKAMALCLLIGFPVSALAADGVTGIVAGVGAGGIVALRSEPAQRWQPRALGVVVAAAYAFVMVRMAGGLALVAAPVFPFTAIGMSDHVVEWWEARA